MKIDGGNNQVEAQVKIDSVDKAKSADINNGANSSITVAKTVSETAVNDMRFTGQTMKFQLSKTFDANALAALVNKPNVAAAQSVATTPEATDIDEAAKRVWADAFSDPSAGAQTLAQEIDSLNAKYGPEAGGKLIAKLNQDQKADRYDKDLNSILTFAGKDLNETQKNSLGQAVGQAYESMNDKDRADFVNDAARMIREDGFGRGGFLNGNTTGIADIISRSSSTALKQDEVTAILSEASTIKPGLFGNNGGVDVRNLYNSAAIIANGGDKASQVKMFDDIIKSFPKLDKTEFNSLMEDPAFKDNLSKVFINNSENIMHSLTAQNGRYRDSKSVDGLEKFFELTMFSRNPGSLRESVMGSAVKLVSQFADPSASPTAGRDKSADAYIGGSLIGLIQAAALNQKDAIKDDQKSREDTVKMLTGLAFAAVPGASKVLGEGADKILQTAYDKAKDFAKDHTESAISGVINNLVDGEALKNIDEGFKAIRDLRYAITGGTLADNKELADSFELGYAATGVDQLFRKLFGG